MSRVKNSPNQEWSAQAVETGWLVVTITVPLAFNPWGTSAFELPKTALLTALILLMGSAALAQAVESAALAQAVEKEHLQLHRPKTPLLLPVLLLGGAYILATIFSVNPRVSLWGSYERQQGLFTQGAYLALFLLTATNLHTHTQVERLWKVLVWGSAPVAAYGLLQAAGLDPLGWQTTGASTVLSTAGRSNFLGSYLVIIAPLTAARLFQARRRWPYAILLAGQLICLTLTQARGAWVGMGAAIIVGLLARTVTTRNWRLALAALALAMLGVGFVAVLNVPDGPLAPLAHLPGLDRLANLTRTDAGSAGARVTIWRATLPLIISRPWLGYGPETMRTVFARVFPPELVFLEGRHAVIDRAHNLWLDLGMSAGLAGIVTFGAILAGFGRLAWRGLRQSPDRQEQIGWTALSAAIVGHLVDMQFSFDLTASATVFWLALAMAAALGRAFPSPGAGRNRKPGKGPLRRNLYLLPPCLVLLAIIGTICLRPLLADVAYWKSQDPNRSSVERVEASIQAVRLWSLEPTYRLGLAWYLVQVGDMPAAEAQLAATTRLAPNDPRIWTAWGDLYMAWGERDADLYKQAEEAYQELLTLAPNVARYHMAMGLALAQQDRLEEGIVETEQAAALDATDAIIYSQLADLYWALGQEDAASQAKATYDQLTAWEESKQ